MIYLRNQYSFNKDIFHFYPHGESFVFKIPTADDGTIEITINSKALTVFYSIEPSDELYYSFQQNINREEFGEAVENEIESYSSVMLFATKKLINFLKYSLNNFMIDESILDLRSFCWSDDRINWHCISIRYFLTHGLSDYPLVLTKERAQIIQEYIVNNQEPFISLRHLHRAKIELNPRFRWIEATTAAELAIKEFLLRYVPNIQALLLELPSPPITKLYGAILESYTGQRSPKVKQLGIGIGKRNKLVHRPEEISISYEESEEYVRDVEIAIFHLLKILYPYDLIIDDIVNPKIIVETTVSVINDGK